ncbi:hypothetical protein [Solimicrobium silvestre]|uniref:Uncharacterized protein n=1 Tax=Solimicrobium silvestre TaxID=2099400 RepID=A0A2S9GXI3_9BURK|nr:hypothetical protein [Solimicrobium silvestre]PRC92435.1 hypothetical protein S2091_2810 [Solimicrobium silvestre]
MNHISADPRLWDKHAPTHENGAAKHTVRITPRGVKMHFSVNTNHITELRHLIMTTCGDLLIFMQIQPVEHATRMQVELCMKIPALQRVTAAIQHTSMNVALTCI